MAKRLTNWDKLSARDISSELQWYDFYENQQLDRGTLGDGVSFTKFLLLDIAISIAFFFGFYILYGFFAAIQVFVAGKTGINESMYYVMHFTFARFMISFFASLAFFGIMYLVLRGPWRSQNAMSDTKDINQYPNDQHIALPEEIQRKFDWFPDVGATSDVVFSSMISHCALSNKGLNPVDFARRVPENICDDDGDVLLYKGEILKDTEGNTLFDKVPMIDIAFMNALYSASGIPDDKRLRKFFDPTQIPYNPGNKNRDKLKGYDTVADLINGDWQLPEYEPQRPAGAYIVDTAPVNTIQMVCGVINA